MKKIYFLEKNRPGVAVTLNYTLPLLFVKDGIYNQSVLFQPVHCLCFIDLLQQHGLLHWPRITSIYNSNSSNCGAVLQ